MPGHVEGLRRDLEAAERELRDHLASWEYAFAMGSSRHGGAAHPRHQRTHERTAELLERRDGLRARVAEHDL